MRARTLVLVLLLATNCDKGAGTADSDGMAGECHADPDYQCGPENCASLESNTTPRWQCGDDTLFDKTGCMRPRCSADNGFDCPEGTTCSITEPMPSVIECFESEGVCECSVSGDLDPNTGVCV